MYRQKLYRKPDPLSMAWVGSPLLNNVKGVWLFGEGGNSLPRNSLNNRPATLINGTTAYRQDTGLAGPAFVYSNAANTALSLGNVGATSTGITLVLRMMFTDLTLSFQQLITKANTLVTDINWWLTTGNDTGARKKKGLEFIYGMVTNVWNTGDVFTVNRWHNIALSYGGNVEPGPTIYVDGQRCPGAWTTGGIGAMAANTEPVFLGSYQGLAGSMSGAVSFVAIATSFTLDSALQQLSMDPLQILSDHPLTRFYTDAQTGPANARLGDFNIVTG